MAQFSTRAGPHNIVRPRSIGSTGRGISAAFTLHHGTSFHEQFALPSEPRAQLVYEDPLVAIFSKSSGQSVHSRTSWKHGLVRKGFSGAFPVTTEALAQLRHSASRSNIFPTFTPSVFGSGLMLITRSRHLDEHYRRMLRRGARHITKLASGGNMRDLFAVASSSNNGSVDVDAVPSRGMVVRHMVLVEGLFEHDVGAVDATVRLRKRPANNDGVANRRAPWLRAREFHLTNPRPTRVVVPYRVLRAWPDLGVSLIETVGAVSTRVLAKALSQTGTPVVGDVENGAWRYWPTVAGYACHVRSIAMRHPSTGRPMHFVAAPPRSFVEWHHPAALGVTSVADLDPDAVSSSIDRELDAIDAVVVSIRADAGLAAPVASFVAAHVDTAAAREPTATRAANPKLPLHAPLPLGAPRQRTAAADDDHVMETVPAAHSVLRHEAWQRRMAHSSVLPAWAAGSRDGSGRSSGDGVARPPSAWGEFSDPELA